MLPRSGNTDVMAEVDQMVMFYLMTRRRINLDRLILDFILVVVNAERRRHATLPYDLFLSRVFIKAQLPLDRHKADNKIPTTMMNLLNFGIENPSSRKREGEISLSNS